jgi:hypothetical protein
VRTVDEHAIGASADADRATDDYATIDERATQADDRRLDRLDGDERLRNDGRRAREERAHLPIGGREPGIVDDRTPWTVTAEYEETVATLED